MNDIRMYEQAIARLRKVLAHLGANQASQQSIESRDEVMRRFQPIFSIEHLPDLSQEEFHAFLLLKNNQHWSGLQRHSPKMCADMPLLRSALTALIDETQPIESRLDQAATTVHGMGKAVATAILLIVYPEKYGVWNSTSEGGLKALNLWPRFERGESLGDRYAKINQILNQLANDLQIDLWTLDVLWWDLEVSPDVPTEAPPSDELPRQEFLDQVAQAMHAELPSHLAPSAVRNRGNYLQIAYPEFRISHLHYEVYPLKSRHEVALHLESAPEINLAWLEHFQPEIAQLRQSLGYPVQAERWGHKSARVSISFPPRSLTAALAQEMGTLMARFIQATYPIMQEALAATPLPLPARRRRRVKPTDDAERRYQLLDAEVRTIRDFLDGNTASRPSDERLCYWVYLCLTFELHNEGWRLFTLIDPSQVPKTLYERTNRFAQACRIRAEVQT